MDCAVNHQVAGIRGQCGGGITCSTCHGYVEPGWLERLRPPVPDEVELLGYVPGRRAASRLTCQIVLSPSLDGIVIHVPPVPAGGGEERDG
jgi:2Fe-2S ferredoxin